MNQATATVAESVDTRRAAVDAIIQSAVFRRSPRLREMLLHIANATLNGDVDELTETRIAAKVFGRPEYNSAEDNLVRVSARQLRAKIAEYYEGEGRNDETILDVPKGGYLAAFHTRHDFAARANPAPNPAERVSETVPRSYRGLAFILACAVAALVVLTAWLWKEDHRLRSVAATVSAPLLFDALLPAGGQRTHIVLTDSALVLLEQILHRYISVEDYASQRYLKLAPDDAVEAGTTGLLPILRTRQISSLADLHIVTTIYQRYPGAGADLAIHHARNMQVRNFDTRDNFVLIGSSRSNPWASLFEAPLAFHLQNQFGSLCFENTHARAGERRLYCVEDSTHEEGTDYAHVAILHTGTGRGRVLLIAGADMESTEAAGEFVLNSRSVQPVLRALHAKRVTDLPDFELLLKTYSVGGSGRSPELVYAHQL